MLFPLMEHHPILNTLFCSIKFFFRLGLNSLKVENYQVYLEAIFVVEAEVWPPIASPPDFHGKRAEPELFIYMRIKMLVRARNFAIF